MVENGVVVEWGMKGGDVKGGYDVVAGGKEGGGENVEGEVSVSYTSMCSRVVGFSQGGGMISARC